MAGEPQIVSTKLSADEFLEWPEGDQLRYELIDGEVLVTPAPNIEHQFIVGRIFRHLDEFLEAHPIGRAFISPVDVRMDDENVFQPDVFVILTEHLDRVVPENVRGAPDLAVEVLSKKTRSRDRILKLRVYERRRVPEIWFIDPKTKAVELLRLGGEAYVKAETLSRGGVIATPLLPGFSLAVARLFP